MEDCGARLGLAPERVEAEGVADWAAAKGLDQVVTPHAPVGPAADALRRAQEALAARGVPLTRVLRPYDGEAWPHATHGYFRFKKAIPRLLDAIGVAQAA